jgi:hypothetical protein
LLYPFWKPRNAKEIPEYSRDAQDIERFQNGIARESEVKFVSMNYSELWENWKNNSSLAEWANYQILS